MPTRRSQGSSPLTDVPPNTGEPEPGRSNGKPTEPGDGRRRKPSRGQGREALCRATVRVVLTKGIDGVTFRSVAAEAGVTHGLASYHFANRETMIYEAFNWAAERGVERELKATQEAAEEGSRNAHFAAYLPALINEAGDEAQFQFHLALEALRTPELLKKVQMSYDQYIEATRVHLDRFGIDATDDLARLVFAAKDGLVLQQLVYRDSELIERALNILNDLLAALRKPTEHSDN